MSLPPIWVRRLVIAPAVVVLAFALLTTLPLWLVLALIASPLTYLGMSRWLEGFAYRVPLGPGLFVLVGLAALAIALLSVAHQSIRAAVAAVMSVTMKPGATAFTVTPNPPSSIASVFVNPCRPAFAAE